MCCKLQCMSCMFIQRIVQFDLMNTRIRNCMMRKNSDSTQLNTPAYLQGFYARGCSTCHVYKENLTESIDDVLSLMINSICFSTYSAQILGLEVSKC